MKNKNMPNMPRSFWTMLKQMGWEDACTLQAIDDTGRNALMVAISNQLPEVEEMMDKGSDVKLQDDLGWTPLAYLAFAHIFTESSESIPLLPIVKKMISLGANINQKDHEGIPVVFHTMDNPVLLGYFLELGANPFLPNEEGDTLLMKALDTKNEAVLAVLRPYLEKKILEDSLPTPSLHKPSKKL